MLRVDVGLQQGRFTLDVKAESDARVIGLIGRSGSGKTTLLNCIAGLTAPQRGVVELDGSALFDSQSGSLPMHRRGVGYVFQDRLLFPHMTVKGNLQYGMNSVDRYGRRSGASEVESARTEVGGSQKKGVAPANSRCEDMPAQCTFDDVVTTLDLVQLLDRYPGTLSGGEACRIAIGRALLSHPRLLLLDEPLTGLDRAAALAVLGFLQRTTDQFGIPAIYVSHSISDVIFLCEQAWLMDAGRIVSAGPPRDLLARSEQLTGKGFDLTNLFVAQRLPDQPRVFDIAGRSLVVAYDATNIETAVLSVRAADIILSREKPTRISARNVLPGTVARLVRADDHIVAFVDVGAEWMVELTASAVDELELREGADVFAIIKASAVAVRGI